MEWVKKLGWKTIELPSLPPGPGAYFRNFTVTSLRVDGRDVDDATEMSDQFNLHFSTIADKLRGSLYQYPNGPLKASQLC